MIEPKTPAGSIPEPRDLLRDLFDAAVAQAQPSRQMPLNLPQPTSGRLITNRLKIAVVRNFAT